MVALGLLGSLDPRQSGGLERFEGVPFAARSAAQREEAVEPVASTSSASFVYPPPAAAPMFLLAHAYVRYMGPS